MRNERQLREWGEWCAARAGHTFVYVQRLNLFVSYSTLTGQPFMRQPLPAHEMAPLLSRDVQDSLARHGPHSSGDDLGYLVNGVPLPIAQNSDYRAERPRPAGEAEWEGLLTLVRLPLN